MRPIRRFFLGSLLAANVFMPSCVVSPTQLLVVVDSNAPQPACFGVLVSRVTEPNTAEPGATRTFFAVPMTRTPFSFGVSPPGGDIRRRVQVSVEMLANCADPSPSDRLIRSTVRTGFLENQVLRLPIFLNASCELCDAESTCQEGASTCAPIPDVMPRTLTPVTPGNEFEDASSDAGLAIDARSVDAAASDVPDAFAARDAGPPPACTSLPTATYQGAFFVPPIAVTPRLSSVGWRAFANDRSSTTYWSTGLTDAPTGGTQLLDTSGFSSLGPLTTLAATTLPASDAITVLGSLPTSRDVYRWDPRMMASTVISTAGPLRPESAIAHLGPEVLYTISDASNRTAILRATMPVPPLYTTTETERESALATAGGGALVAFGEGASGGACEVRTISAARIVGDAINVPVAGQCAHVAIAHLGMNRAVLVYVLASRGVSEVFAQEIDLSTSSLVGAPLDLGPARTTLPARPQVWADAGGAYRAVWPMDAAVGTASVAGGSVVNRHCITGPAGTNYETVRSARQGATTFVLVQGGGRSGQGLQYATLTD